MPDTVSRTVRLPLKRPDDETWHTLRKTALQAARFGNGMLAAQYAAMRANLPKELRKQLDAAVWAEANDTLSGWVRGAVAQRVRGYWRRSAKDVLAGRERVACFSGDRALAITADLTNNRGVLYEREGEHFVLRCRFEPVKIPGGGKREPIDLIVDLDSPGARNDWHIREAVESIWSGAWSPGVVTIRFDRRRRKLDALVSYSRPASPMQQGGEGATLGPYNPETGELWLRFDNDRSAAINFADRVHRMLAMKEHYHGLTRRLRRSMGRGKGRRQAYRRKLEEMGSFSKWSKGVLHQWSRDVVAACAKHGVTELRVESLGVGDLPWHELGQQIAYKARDAGIEIAVPAVVQDATHRAKKAELAKRTRRLKKAKDGLDATRELLGDAGEQAA